jgi:hypothetical protein
MKAAIRISRIILILCLIHYVNVQQKQKRMKLAGLSYTNGCYAEALHLCDQLTKNRNECYDKALSDCEMWGSRYQKALEDFKKR